MDAFSNTVSKYTQPPPTGGFLQYSPNRRSLPRMFNRPTSFDRCFLEIEPSRREISNEEKLYAERKAAERQVLKSPFDPKKSERVSTAKLNFSTVSQGSKIPILKSSFVLSCEEELRRRRERYVEGGTQTDDILEKRNFAGLSEYTSWMMKDVDPLLQSLRDAILQQKPKDVRAYAIAFCTRIGEPPKTVAVRKEDVEPSKPPDRQALGRQVIISQLIDKDMLKDIKDNLG